VCSVDRFELTVGLPTPCLRVSGLLYYYHSAKLHSGTSKMTRIKLLILNITAVGYAIVLLPIFQTVGCQIL